MTDDAAVVDASTSRRTLIDLLRGEKSIRLVVAGYLTGSIGYGLYLTGSSVYFVRSVGLSPAQVGFGLSAAGVLSFIGAVPIGRSADRYGPKRLTLIFTGCQVVLLILASQIRTFAPFVACIAMLGLAETGANISRGAIMAYLVGRGERVRLSALTRSVFNAGFAVGTLAAGVAIGVDTRAAYLSLILGNAAATAIVLVLYASLPARPPSAEPTQRRRSGFATGLRDLPFAALAQVSMVVHLGEVILSVGLPLWIVTHTTAPRQLAAWLIIVNTVAVVLLQTRAARPAETLAGATRIQQVAFGCLAAACGALVVTGRLPTPVAVPVLVVVLLLATAGEMFGDAAAWAFRFELAPATAQGEYGAVFGLGMALPTVLGPIIVTELPSRFPGFGWLLVGLVFVVAAVLCRPVFNWVQRSRPADARA